MRTLSTARRPRQAPSETTRSRRVRATTWIAELHDRATDLMHRLDHGGEFDEELWTRPGGGGGITRVLSEGETFEKAGVNRSAVDGVLPPEAVSRLGGGPSTKDAVRFFATGLSIVVHPRSPLVPTVHLNVRYFELMDEAGSVCDAWFGGGTDLTPTYPDESDARHFHRELRAICSTYGAGVYPTFKSYCDSYFRNTHRGGEPRGIGGIFFDHLRDGDYGFDPARQFAFGEDVGRSLERTYAPLVEAKRLQPYGERERHLQLMRRARYVEFNLLHDRGTHFGLQTSARAESVLMSLPPCAEWVYPRRAPVDPLQASLSNMLIPRDWASTNA